MSQCCGGWGRRKIEAYTRDATGDELKLLCLCIYGVEAKTGFVTVLEHHLLCCGDKGCKQLRGNATGEELKSLGL